jgi:hypothetical protein
MLYDRQRRRTFRLHTLVEVGLAYVQAHARLSLLSSITLHGTVDRASNNNDLPRYFIAISMMTFWATPYKRAYELLALVALDVGA